MGSPTRCSHKGWYVGSKFRGPPVLSYGVSRAYSKQTRGAGSWKAATSRQFIELGRYLLLPRASYRSCLVAPFSTCLRSGAKLVRHHPSCAVFALQEQQPTLLRQRW